MMKCYKLLFVAICLSVSNIVTAQSISAGNQNNNEKVSTINNKLRGVKFSYNPITISSKNSDVEDMNLHGLSLGLYGAWGVVEKIPLYVRLDVNIRYAFKTEEDTETSGYYRIEQKETFSMLTEHMSLDLGYNHSFNKKFSIFPFVGLVAQAHFLGKDKLMSTIFYKGKKEDTEEQTIDVFNEDDMGGSKYKWKQLQVGWQIGVQLNINSLSLSASYGSDFNEIAKGLKTSVPAISLGVNF